MKREDIERKLDTAVSGMIPKDMFDRISENIVSANPKAIERVVKKEKKKNFNIFGRSFMGVATAACILLVAGIIGVPYYGNNFVPDTYVDIDVNPGVEIVTNKKNKVLNVQSTNKDGDSVIDGMNLKNTELKVAVNALIGSMVQKGYIANNNTGILVTVRNDNSEKANKVKEEVLYDINFVLYTNDVQANVMNQTFKNTADANKFARENNISIGKAVFVLNLAAKDSSLDAKELAKMKVTDIANLVAKKGIDIRDIVDYDDDDSIWENIADAIEDIDEDAGISMNKETRPGDKKQIGVEAAKQIAFAHAKVALKDVTFIKAELDTEDGRAVYEVEFYSGNVEYDYDIDALSGEIISNDFDIEDYSIPAQSAAAPQQTEVSQQTAAAPAPTAPAANTPSGDIGIERAKQIALSHAGLSQGSVSFVKAELDHEDGVKVYDIEFYSGNVEYDYGINAATGAIISVDRDIENYSIPTAAPAPAPTPAPTAAPTPTPTAAPAPTQPAAPSTISAERAKQIALSHAGVGGASFTKVELDTDDGVAVYEIEFKVDNVEYDYEINAVSGAIISSKSEVDD
ncbi:PepSY domain-containing protein [Lachnoanaerobaculum sp. Marseille-Q4761]|uniref:PepSY domain-containing protein n=1 Tax=Lachnoanaerobaculum sp. Marseille-Q4761 TaxID=2819511 RepID=UPI001AA0B332|nr:PepSY domain-containing protein [Lachnoanaerobaculum sp. Marseille-Q4761]MBO1871302.1 PepSY domain-containing protein [Lachnoanaerobaculum sp. Marseille-Q4761]